MGQHGGDCHCVFLGRKEKKSCKIILNLYDRKGGMRVKLHSFRAKIICALLGFAVLIGVSICVTVDINYIDTELDQYSDTAYSYAKAAADFIDGDRVLSYVETGEKDEYYDQVLHFLNSIQAQENILYYYVFVPCESDLVYVWDADILERACPLGYHKEYMEGGKEASFRAMDGNPKERLIHNYDPTYGDLGSVFFPIYNSAGESVALVGVDLSLMDMAENLMRFISMIVGCILVVILICIIVMYMFFNKFFMKPVKTLISAAHNMVGNLENENDVNINVKTGDEIEELAMSFNQMYVEVKDYIRKLENVTAEKERIGAELSVATHIQASMLPCIFPAFPDRKEFDIFASMDPAKEVGGDFYDFFMVDDRHLAVVMADVSGKGVPAALFMAIGKTLIKDHTLQGLALGDVFSDVNNLLCASNGEGMFITAFEGVLDLLTGEFSYVNAGHEPPYLCRKGENYEQFKVLPGFILAGIEDMGYQVGKTVLNPGDKLFLYTDGVPEATDASEELYGFDRMQNVLNRNKDKVPEELLPLVKADVDLFVGSAPQFDDLTMLGLEYREKMREA